MNMSNYQRFFTRRSNDEADCLAVLFFKLTEHTNLAYRLGKILKSLYGGHAAKGWNHFLYEGLTPQGTM